MVLGLVAHLPPARMVTVLLSTLRVTRGCLDVATGRRTDPDVGPGWGNSEGLDSPQRIGIVNRLTVEADVAETPASSLPPNARHRIADVVQAGCTGRFDRIGSERFRAFECSG